MNNPATVGGIDIGFAVGALSFTAVTAWRFRGIQRSEKEMIEGLDRVAKKFAESANLLNALVKKMKRIDDT